MNETRQKSYDLMYKILELIENHDHQGLSVILTALWGACAMVSIDRDIPEEKFLSEMAGVYKHYKQKMRGDAKESNE
jgi:homoserine trans-succinylase